MAKKIVKKAFFNKKNKQYSVSIPKKQIKSSGTTIKFGEELFVELKVFNKKRKK